MKVNAPCLLFVSALLSTQSGALPLWADPVATTTSLTIYSGANTVVSNGSVASGSEIMLAATVKAGAVGVSPGQVNFCDASATSCTDIHLLGTAQLVQTDPTAGISIIFVSSRHRQPRIQSGLCGNAEWRHALRQQQFRYRVAHGHRNLSDQNFDCRQWRRG